MYGIYTLSPNPPKLNELTPTTLFATTSDSVAWLGSDFTACTCFFTSSGK